MPNQNQHISCALIAPVFNEEDAIPVFVDRIEEVFANFPSISVTMIFVDDGSDDKTLEVLLQLQQAGRRIIVVELSRNFGKEAALTAGLAVCGENYDVAVPIDVDLQDPPELVPEMIKKWQEGFDVVWRSASQGKATAF